MHDVYRKFRQSARPVPRRYLAALGLHQQHGGGIHGIARVRIGLDRLQDHAIHHLNSGGNDAAGNDFRDGIGGVIHRIEDRYHRFDGFRQMDNTHNDLGDDAERAFGADQQARQIIAGRILRPAADLDNISFGCDDFQAKHMVSGDAIDQRMRSSRVFANIAADGAGALAAGIGYIVKSVRIEGVAQVQVDQAGLHDGPQVLIIDFKHAVHAT